MLQSKIQFSSVYYINRAKITDQILANLKQSKRVEGDHDDKDNQEDQILEQSLESEFNSSSMMKIIQNYAVNNQIAGGEDNSKRKHSVITGSIHDGFTCHELENSVSLVNQNLEALINKRIERVCLEMKMTLYRVRTPDQQQQYLENKTDILNLLTEPFEMECDLFPTQQNWKESDLKTCLYDDMDLLDAIKAVSTGNASSNTRGDFQEVWSALSVPIRTASLQEFSKEFPELSLKHQHLGLHDLSPKFGLEFASLRIEEGLEVLKADDNRKLREFGKMGIPTSLRREFWRKMVESDIIDHFQSHVTRISRPLNKQVIKYDTMIDRMLHLDSKHSRNDDSYFVFEEMVRDVLLLWSRDDWISTQLQARYPKINIYTQTPNVTNGIIPIWGISLYIMPICYLYPNASEVYAVFREMYIRYFFPLHSLTTNRGFLLEQCAIFENLVKEKDPELFFYLTTELDIQPLDIAFRWILYAFVGVLAIDQVLLMWDRMISFDSIDIVAVTAASLFCFRRSNLLKCLTADEASACFSETGMIKWGPLVLDFLKST